MKNILLLLFCVSFISTASFSQEQEKETAPKVEKEKATKKESLELKPAKKAVKSPAKKVKVNAVRKKESAQREDD